MKCPNCGHHVSKRISYCPYCGWSLNKPEVVQNVYNKIQKERIQKLIVSTLLIGGAAVFLCHMFCF